MTTEEDLGPNQWYVDYMFEQYKSDPASVDETWRRYFDSSPGDFSEAENPPSFVDVDFAVEATLDDTPIEDSPARESVTRSDLPPAPTSHVSPPTSPYVRGREIAAPTELSDSDYGDRIEILKGAGRAVVRNMEASLSVPTATSAREVPAKILIENRQVINAHLGRTVGGKVSFTHLLGYAIVEALVEMPSMNVRYVKDGNKDAIEHLGHVNIGLAIDVPRSDGSRSLLVPVIKAADLMTFNEFRAATDDLIVRARDGQLRADDFKDPSLSLTNPGTIGTTHSVPRLMPGQGAIIGVGATDFPAAWAGAPLARLAKLGLGKTMVLTSTYDHRIIQGAGSGEFLRLLATKLAGEDGFYERIYETLRVPYSPYHWEKDRDYDSEREKDKPARIVELIHAYRSRGHLAADTDPLSYKVRHHPDLELSSYGLTVWDLDRNFPTGGFGDTDHMRLREILIRLRDTYTSSVGVEYMHIQDPDQRLWLQREIEQPYEKPQAGTQIHILATLTRAEAFEEFLQTKFVGQKRFSLEGGESLIPLLDTILNSAARSGLHEVAIGMAHRGRLNVLANIAGKSYGQIFSEFEGKTAGQHGSGDVKYHLGTEGVYTAEDGVATKVYLAANPSHLEAASGVLEGIVRGKQDELDDPSYPVLPLLIHGDAAFIGQGVVSELFNMSQVAGFRTGGTIHVIVNNQIGFTTAPTAGRSTRYATDMAKGMQLPIFHVNADDPESVVRVASLAFKYREAFNKDAIIDMVCYRRRGHNEGDDPSMTQPVMYELINRIPSTRTVYLQNLLGRGDITSEQANKFQESYQAELGNILEETRQHGWEPEAPDRHGLELPEAQRPGSGMMIGWTSAVTKEEIERIGQAYTSFPPDFVPHRKVEQLSQKRLAMANGELPIDWGFAELLALGTLLMDGTPVRFTGQDVQRATFVQRHATLHDAEDGQEFTPLDFLTPDQAPFEIYDSPLSEYAPLAFEYGYSIERPDSLVVWEAQFGDFANGAQTVTDEFISSAEQKWGQQSAIVMLLPHGYEGQGPDHSSARIERYMQLAAEGNMRIVQPSTPANHFHLLRKQAYERPRKPLIEFTPKQLLRLSAATSDRSEFTHGTFKPVLGDEFVEGAPRKILLCSGRIYYDLDARRKELDARDVAIVRLEQLYPLPVDELAAELASLGGAPICWVQDEPENQGAWPFLALNLFPQFGGVTLISRPASASPATGMGWRHREQNEAILEQAFA